jgi:hypothetical protein
LVLLAPSEQAIPSRFASVDTDPGRYHGLLADVQKLRGRVYLEDGAIEPGQLIDSRHQLDIDEGSWHLLVLDGNNRVRGCARYREYPNSTRFSRLTVARSALARCREQGDRLKRAVARELELSRRLDLPYVELGGWALDQSIRGTMDALKMAMATYALSQSLGGAVGISTVTQRHSSSSILRRLGGQSLEHDGGELPPYYDPEYKCGMEVLRFYSWAPNPRFQAWVNDMKNVLRATTVICGGAASPAWLPKLQPRGEFASLALATP